jgi:transposase
MNAYSEDLRKKIVEALESGATKTEAARSFGVSRSSVKRYAKLAGEGHPPRRGAPASSRSSTG